MDIGHQYLTYLPYGLDICPNFREGFIISLLRYKDHCEKINSTHYLHHGKKDPHNPEDSNANCRKYERKSDCSFLSDSSYIYNGNEFVKVADLENLHLKYPSCGLVNDHTVIVTQGRSMYFSLKTLTWSKDMIPPVPWESWGKNGKIVSINNGSLSKKRKDRNKKEKKRRKGKERKKGRRKRKKGKGKRRKVKRKRVRKRKRKERRKKTEKKVLEKSSLLITNNIIYQLSKNNRGWKKIRKVEERLSFDAFLISSNQCYNWKNLNI